MFRKLNLAGLFVVLVASLCFPASASAQDTWVLVQAVGEVRVAAPGGTPAAAKPSSPLPNGATVRTGANGRAVLLRGRETIVMSPSSEVTLPRGPDRDISKVQQRSGTLLFKIGKKPEAHFEVNTPYLAAVVKGTTFTVRVTGVGASVHVLEGAVEVTTLDRMQSYLTRAGQISSVFAKAAHDIFTTGAATLSGGDGRTLWGTDATDFDFSGESPWTLSTDGRAFKSTGLRAVPRKAAEEDQDDALTERASERFTQAAKSVNETMGAAAASKVTQKPKDGSVRVSTADEKPRAYESATPKSDRNDSKKRKDKEPRERGVAQPAPKPANVWTVTQAKGDIEIDGYPFTNFGDGQVRTLPPGTKVETGPNGKLGVAFGLAEYVVEPNSVVVLADAAQEEHPKVVAGAAVRYKEETGRYEAVPNLSPEEVAELTANGGLDDAPSQEAAIASINLSAAGVQASSGGSGAASLPLPKVVTLSNPVNPKTEEVRTKVIGGLTLGLYGLTAVLILAFGARWAWRRHKSKAKEPPAETVAQTRLRNIKGS